MMTLALFLIAGIFYCLAVRLFVRHFLLGWNCLLATALLTHTFGTEAFLLAGFHLSPIDMVSLTLLPAGLIRSRYYELKFSVLNLAMAGYLILICLSLARGTPIFGFSTASTECRGFIGEILAMTYFATIPHDRKVVKKVVISQIALSVAYVILCAGNYAGLPVGGVLTGIDATSAMVSDIGPYRALPVEAAASVGLSVLFAVTWTVYRKHRRWLPLLSAILMVTVVILQHRTVWVMLFVSFLAAFFVDLKVFRLLAKVGGVVVLLGCIGGVAYVGLQNSLGSDLRESATNSDTLEWRFEAWERSVEEDQSVLTFLIGQPFGSKYMRLDTNSGGFTENTPPHNEFINQYLRVGVIGLTCFMIFLLWPIYRYFQSPDSGEILYPAPSVWILATIGLFIFGFPYDYPPQLLALVAMANTLIDTPVDLTSPLSRRRKRIDFSFMKPHEVVTLPLSFATQIDSASPDRSMDFSG